MRSTSLQQRSGEALERACRDVELTVSRVAKVVLHATALADRMDVPGATDPGTALQQQERVRVLREAAEAGRRTLSQVGLSAVSSGAGLHGVRPQTTAGAPAPRRS